MEWAHKILLSVTDDFVDQFRSIGIVEALASIFKVCLCHYFLYFGTAYYSCGVIFSIVT
jgi:hypothetical protein